MKSRIDTSIAAIVERAADAIKHWPKEMQLERNRYPKSRHSIYRDMGDEVEPTEEPEENTQGKIACSG